MYFYSQKSNHVSSPFFSFASKEKGSLTLVKTWTHQDSMGGPESQLPEPYFLYIVSR